MKSNFVKDRIGFLAECSLNVKPYFPITPYAVINDCSEFKNGVVRIDIIVNNLQYYINIPCIDEFVVDKEIAGRCFANLFSLALPDIFEKTDWSNIK